MSRPRTNIAAEVIARARELRAAGTSWAKIGERLGYHENTIRKRLAPEFAARKRFRHTRPARLILAAGEPRITPEEAARAIATIPLDTRSIQARFLGDPLPGRSALDRRRAAIPASLAQTAAQK